jgi:hypothetical protein
MSQKGEESQSSIGITRKYNYLKDVHLSQGSTLISRTYNYLKEVQLSQGSTVTGRKESMIFFIPNWILEKKKSSLLFRNNEELEDAEETALSPCTNRRVFCCTHHTCII